MKNLDALKQQKADILQKLHTAMTDDNEENFSQAFDEYTEFLQEAVMSEAKGLVQSNDNTILAGRGVRALTSEETEYYQKITDAMKSSNPKQSLSDLDKVLPKTTIDQVFDDLVDSHPILDVINFQNTGALIEIIVNNGYAPLSAWGELTATIATEISSGFDKIDLSQNKLSAFIPVAKAMLDLGPVWMDRYVRTILSDALAGGLEVGIIDGDGDKKPIGMTRALTGAVDGVYSRKNTVAITSLDATTYGTILNTLTTVTKTVMVGETPTAVTRRRPVNEILLVVNPTDYFTKVLPATTVRTTDGGFNINVFPFPTKVVQSAAVPSGKAIFGIANKYFFGLGTGKGGKLEYSDEYRFLEDQRVYLVKLYGTGRPLDDNAFIYADISGLTSYVQRVQVTNFPTTMDVDVTDDPLNVLNVTDARLASLKIGALTLSPTFNKSVMVYTAASTDATNTITAVSMDGEATIEILNGETPVVNGTAATWATGENIVTINVTSGTETETYTVTVTKS